MKIQTLFSQDTVYTADCIDFCPIKEYNNLLIVGTYQLETKDSNDSKNNLRLGRLYLFSLTKELNKLQEIEMPGILDARWCPCVIENRVILGIVNAKGELIILSLEDGRKFKEIMKIEVCSNIALHIDWSNKIMNTCSPLITVSDDNGHISIYNFSISDIKLIWKLKAHDYEAWVSCFNYWNTNILYSGADDSKFKTFDLRSDPSVMSVSKCHSAGVTEIQPCLWKEMILFTGCYDGTLKVWDTRQMKEPITDIDLNGGVWRLRCQPEGKHLLASTMHEGFKILKTDSDIPEIIGKYEHQSLAYGADWAHCSKNNSYKIGSVSFYDHLMTISRLDF